MLAIRLLGPLRLTRNGTAVTVKRRKSRALLAYLAVEARPVPRRRLIALLWPDHTEQTARHNLRTALHSLRQTLGDALVADEETLALDPAVDVDLHRLRAVIRNPNATTAALADALDLYQGELLADFDTPDTEEYDDWLLVEREHVRRLVVHGYQQLSARLEAAGDYQAALAALARALALDPFQEDLQRAGLRLHYFSGDRTGALRRYEEFARLLEKEMGVHPMAETRALVDAISAGTLALPATSPLPPNPLPVTAAVQAAPAPLPAARPLPRDEAQLPFAGRAAELAQLEQWRREHKVILVEGAAGLGKTRLVQVFVEQIGAATSQPVLVLWGQARELESRLPYQPLIEALRSVTLLPHWQTLRAALQLPALWWEEVARLLPELASGAGARAPDESRLWEGVYQFLAALSRHADLLLVVDDLHWADAATLGLLAYVARQAASATLPLTLIATSRAITPRSEAGTFLQSLLRENRLARLLLQPLTADEVLVLAQRISPGFGYPLGHWLLRTSEGNPLVLAELVRYARGQGILLENGTVNLSLLPGAPVVPPTVYALIQARLAALSEAARRVLDAAAAVGREFEFEVAARAAALSDTAALDALDELRRERLILEIAGRRFAFDHTLTHEVVYQELGELRRRLLHRRVAAALESIHSDDLDEVAGVLAYHYAEGDQPAAAAKYARRAGERAVRLAAWKAATRFFSQALTATPMDEQPPLLAALGSVLVYAGDLARATETLRAALRLPAVRHDNVSLRRVVETLGEALLLQGRYGEVVELAQAYTDHAQPDLRISAEFMWGAALSLEGLALDEAARHLGNAETLLREQGLEAGAVPVQVAQVHFELGNIDAQQGRLSQAIERYRRALEATRGAPGDAALRSQILAHNNLAYHLHLLRDPQAFDHVQQGLALAQEKGMLTLLPYLLSTLGELHLAQGDLQAAETAFRQGLVHAQRLAQPERIAGLTANLGLAALAQGQTELAVHRFSTALAQADAVPNRFLAAQIRLWLIPLLPIEAARPHLEAARAAIEAGGFGRLRDDLAALTARLDPATAATG